MTEPYGFGHKPPQGDAKALELLDALIEALDAARSLEQAKASVPEYTAQWNPEDYYGQELHERNIAAARLLSVLNSRK